jgi:hypothetical protein
MEHYLEKIKYLALGVFFAPAIAWAEPIISDDKGAPIKTASQVTDYVLRLQNIVAGIAGMVVLGMVVYAGLLYVTSGGNEDRLGTAKKTLTSALIGLILVICAYVIVNVTVWALGGSTS